MAETTLKFLGAAETVTGSRNLVDHDGRRVLVDCGMFQGWKRLRLRNWERLPFGARSVDAVVLTHAHIDHSGFVPRLRRLGYEGPVYCTPGTRDLLEILWPDAAHLQEEQAKHANRFGWTQHQPAAPLYEQADAQAALRQLKVVEFGAEFSLGHGFRAQFRRAGHILGASSVLLHAGGHRILFSGDLGRYHDPIMHPPAAVPAADFVVVESTYGDRAHAEEDVKDQLASVVARTVARKGTLVIPAFAVGRSQHILHLLAELQLEGRCPDVPIYLDSPMAINATEVFARHATSDRDHRLDPEACRRMCEVATYSRTAEQSKAIDRRSGPMIVISASGMATGGRILHHLVRFLPEAKNTVFFVGFQAAGTRGRTLLDGGDEVKIHGGYVKARAEIVKVDALSAHADYLEVLEWLASGRLQPRRVFVNHGEPAAADAMRRRIVDRFGWDAITPDDGSTFRLE